MMGCRRRDVFPLVCHVILLSTMMSLVSAQVLEKCDYSHGSYSQGSTYQRNLNNLLSSLHSNIDPYGFANISSGEPNSDPANALFLCRGDIDYDSCRNCVNSSISTLNTTCPGIKEASGSYDGCMLRYSNRSLTITVEWLGSNGYLNSSRPSIPTNIIQFNQDLASLMIDLRTKAARGGSRMKFAAANKTIPDFQTIYALLQCTPDITEEDCTNCLIDVISMIPNCCNGTNNGVVISWGCQLLFDNIMFYNETRVLELLPQPLPPEPSPDSGNNNRSSNSNQTVTIVAISVSSVVGLISIVSLCFIIISRRSKKHKKKKKKKKKKKPPVISSNPTDGLDSSMNNMGSTEIVQYDFKTIKEATNDFSNDNRLGQGGFGVVYKGLFSNGQEIAAKRLSREHGQGHQEFKNEVVLVAKLQHRNLVKILGYCLDGTERLLVYEFLANSSLDKFLFDPVKRRQLDWQRRYKIIGGIARGLLYLHEDSRVRIIHRDMKVSNILLDAEMNPKISDFGMAKLSAMDETRENTSKVVGTYGYMAPEYMMYGQFSIKSDVFSFGVLLLEIVSGQKNSSSFDNGEDLSSFAWRCWREKRASDMIDPMLRDAGESVGEMIRCIHIGLLCIQDNASDRPTMASVVLMFNSFYISLPVPSQPTFFLSRGRATPLQQHDVSGVSEESGLIRSTGTKNHSTGNDSITELYPR